MTQRSLTTRIGTSAMVAMLMFAMMVGLGRSVPSALAADGTFPWTGQGMNPITGKLNDPDACDVLAPGQMQWNLTGATGVTAATLSISVGGNVVESVGIGVDNGNVKFFITSGTYDLLGITASVAYTGTLSDRAILTISHGCVPALVPLVVTKDAATTYEETYTWGITKTVTPASVTLLYGGTDSASFSYTVTVTPTGPSYSYAVNGNINIQNTNTVPVTVSNISDVMSDGTVATVTCGDYVVPADGSITLEVPASSTVSCTYSATLLGATNLINTVTVVNDIVPAAAPGIADVIFGSPTVKDNCVNVVDAFNLGVAESVNPSVCVGDPGTFTYPRTITREMVTTACDTPQYFPNTATFTTNTTLATGTAGASVAVTEQCQPKYWCSPGFWSQNYPNLITTPYNIEPLLSNLYSSIPGGALLKKGSPATPTIGQVLANPNTYGGPAFNSVGNYFASYFGWIGTQATGDNCPINAHGTWTAPLA